MINGVIKWYCLKCEFWEGFFHFSANKRIDAVIVANVEESSGNQIISEIGGFLVRKNDVSMASEEAKRVTVYISGSHLGYRLGGCQICPNMRIRILGQIWKGCSATIPIPAAIIFEST
jgi:hypothetical protein